MRGEHGPPVGPMVQKFHFSKFRLRIPVSGPRPELSEVSAHDIIDPDPELGHLHWPRAADHRGVQELAAQSLPGIHRRPSERCDRRLLPLIAAECGFKHTREKPAMREMSVCAFSGHQR